MTKKKVCVLYCLGYEYIMNTYVCMYVYTCFHLYIHIHTGMTTIINGMATVTVDGLECEVTYDITAGGTLNGALVGPRSSHGTITSGPCPLPMPTPSVDTPSMSGKEISMYMYIDECYCLISRYFIQVLVTL